jgi:hypothetical protein
MVYIKNRRIRTVRLNLDTAVLGVKEFDEVSQLVNWLAVWLPTCQDHVAVCGDAVCNNARSCQPHFMSGHIDFLRPFCVTPAAPEITSLESDEPRDRPLWDLADFSAD